ncbi:MAG: rRNA maturation RNase YbeY [Thermodesulfobacteriota bacterium]
MSLKRIREAARVVLDALDSPDGELSILIVDDAQIAELNWSYLNRRGPTNVIAFPMRSGKFQHVAPDLLGDIVISAQTADHEAASSGIPVKDRFLELLVHGILHLFGYDHESDLKSARRMQRKSRQLLHLIDQSGSG